MRTKQEALVTVIYTDSLFRFSSTVNDLQDRECLPGKLWLYFALLILDNPGHCNLIKDTVASEILICFELQTLAPWQLSIKSHGLCSDTGLRLKTNIKMLLEGSKPEISLAKVEDVFRKTQNGWRWDSTWKKHRMHLPKVNTSSIICFCLQREA